MDEESLGMGRAVYLYLKGLWWESGGDNGRESDRTGRGGWSHYRLWKGEAYIRASSEWDHYPKENILHIEHGESLNFRRLLIGYL